MERDTKEDLTVSGRERQTDREGFSVLMQNTQVECNEREEE